MSQLAKKDVLVRFKTAIQKVYPPLPGHKPKYKQGCYSTPGPDGSEVFLAVETTTKGCQVGTFDAYTSFGIDGGTVFQVMADIGLEKNDRFPGNGMVRGILHNYLDIVPFHLFDERTDLASEMDKILREITNLYLPLIFGLTKDFGAGLNLLLSAFSKERVPFRLRNPFTTVVILCHLAGQPRRPLELAESSIGLKGYYDLDSQFQAKILVPVARWFEQHQLTP